MLVITLVLNELDYFPSLQNISPVILLMKVIAAILLTEMRGDQETTHHPGINNYYLHKLDSKNKQAGVELGLTQAETVSLELGLIRAELENIIWSPKNLIPILFNLNWHAKFQLPMFSVICVFSQDSCKS